MPLVGAGGFFAGIAASREQLQKVYPSAYGYFSLSLGFSPLYQGVEGLALHPYPPVNKKLWGNSNTTFLTNTKQCEDASVFQMNLRMEQ